MTVRSETLNQLTKAYQLIRCEEMLRAAERLVRLYGQMKGLVRPEGKLKTSYFASQQDELGEEIQLIQYQLFVLGWSGKPEKRSSRKKTATTSRIAYALCLSKIVGQESLLQKTTRDCLRMAESAGYSVLQKHLERILAGSLERLDALLDTRQQATA